MQLIIRGSYFCHSSFVIRTACVRTFGWYDLICKPDICPKHGAIQTFGRSVYCVTNQSTGCWGYDELVPTAIDNAWLIGAGRQVLSTVAGRPRIRRVLEDPDR